MPPRSVQVTVGPVEGSIALAWIDHWLDVLAAIASREEELSITLAPGAVDRIVRVLQQWQRIAAASTTFWWRFETTDASLQLVEDWLAIGALTDHDLALLGATWAPDPLRPMSEAVVEGVTAALTALGEQGDALRHQIER